jgi:hypothetical protein
LGQLGDGVRLREPAAVFLWFANARRIPFAAVFERDHLKAKLPSPILVFIRLKIKGIGYLAASGTTPGQVGLHENRWQLCARIGAVGLRFTRKQLTARYVCRAGVDPRSTTLNGLRRNWKCSQRKAASRVVRFTVRSIECWKQIMLRTLSDRCNFKVHVGALGLGLQQRFAFLEENDCLEPGS